MAHEIVDDFNDNTINTADWNNWGGAQVTEEDQALTLTTTLAPGYYGIQRHTTVDLNGRYIGVRLRTAGDQSIATYAAFPIDVQFSTSNEAYWQITGGNLIAYTNIGGVFTPRVTLPLNTAVQRYLVVGVDSGQLVWAYSADSYSWTVAFTMAHPFGGDTVALPFVMIGQDSPASTTTALVVDDYGFYDLTAPAPAPQPVLPLNRDRGWRDYLDLPTYIGQVGHTFRFDVVDAVTGLLRGRLSPRKEPVPSLEHDTTSTISRKLTLTLSVEDAEWFRPLSDRVMVTMVLGDPDATEFPLGRYLTADEAPVLFSQGTVNPITFYDEMFIVDQELEEGFNANGYPADYALRNLLEHVPVEVMLEAPLGEQVTQSWGAGSGRGGAVLDLATAGGYFKPWFDHLNRLRFIQAFEPGDRLPDINLDTENRVIRDSVAFGNDLATAPNRWIVRSNQTGLVLGDEGAEATTTFPAVVGRYDVPATAPFSISQRGFVIPKTVEAQVRTQTAAAIYARTLGLQRSNYERCTLSTPPDPRHDGYNVIRFNGVNWLEIGWSMPLASGGAMSHTLRRAYPSTSEEDPL